MKHRHDLDRKKNGRVYCGCGHYEIDTSCVKCCSCGVDTPASRIFLHNGSYYCDSDLRERLYREHGFTEKQVSEIATMNNRVQLKMLNKLYTYKP